MQIAQVLSGFSLGEADLLRRAMGKKIKKEMDGAEGALRRGRGRQRRGPRPRRIYLRAGGEVRGLRLQQIARRGLCADRLPDRLSQGQLPDRVHRRLDDARHGQRRQAERLRPGGAPAWALRIEPPSVNRSEVGFMPSEGAIRYSLAALKNVGRQAVEHLCAEREARRTVPRRVGFRAAHQSAPSEQARARDACRRRRAR